MMEPRSARQLVRAAFELYRRYPLLFLILAAGVIVPYEVIVLATTGAGPFAHGSLSFGASSLLTLIELALIGPLVSALHVHAVSEVSEGRKPRLASVARQGLRVLPVVAAAAIIAWLGILLGFLAFVVPGIILSLRWYVVAQAAAIEHEGWLPALRRSRQLTAGHYRHLIVFAIYVTLITSVPTLLVGFAFGHETTTVASFLVGVVLQIVTWSLSALAAALMYFDLRARLASTAAQPGSAPAAPGRRPPADQLQLGSKGLLRPGSTEGLVHRPRIPRSNALLGDWRSTGVERHHSSTSKGKTGVAKGTRRSRLVENCPPLRRRRDRRALLVRRALQADAPSLDATDLSASW
jgi:hypothetical protein